MIFIRDMERLKKQKAQTFGQGGMDLVAYVEFQSQMRRVRGWRRRRQRTPLTPTCFPIAPPPPPPPPVTDPAQAIYTHKKAFRYMRTFWRYVGQEGGVVETTSLGKLLRSLDKHESVAELTYIQLLKKYPRSVKLLRSFGLFQLVSRGAGPSRAVRERQPTLLDPAGDQEQP